MKLQFHLEQMLKLLSRIAIPKKILRHGFRNVVSARLVCDLPILCAWICLVTFSVADKMPEQKNLREKVSTLNHSLRVQLITVGKSLRQKLGAAGHIVHTLRKQE